jgi:hypothetical protein
MLSKEYLKDNTDKSQEEIDSELKGIINQVDPLPHHTTLVKTIA